MPRIRHAGLTIVLLSTTMGCDYCVQPLSEWCGGPECPTYQDLMADDCDTDAEYRCGYATLGVGPGGQSFWFNGKGKLVAVHEFSDIPEFCGDSQHQVWYGRKVTCDQEPEYGEPPCGE